MNSEEMNPRVLGFGLLAVAVIGTVLVFSNADNETARLLVRGGGGFMYALSQGVTALGFPFGLALAVCVAVGLAGVGLMIFGKPKE